MVFKQVGTDVDKLSLVFKKFWSNFGLFNKSFTEIGKDFKNGIGIRSLTNFVSKQDVQSLNNFNRELTQGVKFSEAFRHNLSNSHTYVQKQAVAIARLNNQQKILKNQLNANKITQEQYNTAMATNKAQMQSLTSATNQLTFAQKASAVASKALGTALNIAMNVGLTLAINVIISLISKLVNRQEELREEIKETADQARETSKEIFDLYNQYSELSKAVLTDASNKEQLASVTDSLLEKLGYEKSAVQDLVNEYGNLDNAIKNITIQELQEQQDALIADYSLKKGNLLDDSNAFTDSLYSDDAKKMRINVGVDYVLDSHDPILKDVFKILTDSNIFDEVSSSTLKLRNTNETYEDVLANYNAITKAVDLLKDKFNYELLGDNKVFTSLLSQQSTLKTKIDEYNTAVGSLNKNVAQEQILYSLLGKQIPDTVDEFEEYKDTLINSALANDNFVGTEEDVRKAIESSLASMPEFAKFFEVTAKTVKQDAIPSFTNLATSITKAQDAMEDFMGVAGKFGQAIGKAISGAALSTEEMLELLKLAPELASKFEKVGVDEWSAPSNVLLQSATEYGSANNPYNTDYQNSLNTVEQLRKTIAQQEQMIASLTVRDEHTAKQHYNLQKSL